MMRGWVEEGCQMRKVLVWAAALMLAGAGVAMAASAAQKRNAMHHIAQAIAAQNLCDRVEANTTMLGLVSTTMGIDINGADRELLMADTKAQIQSMKDLDKDSVCGSALLLYGPNGMNVPDLLRSK
ncbi:hypothetical protein PPF1_73 [Rhizobium phage vB_RleM_PPF1]|uniref:hypothetical protein n=1 Tax=Rhizobium phage vB_RleM_PPF1 TaxID=1498228 RepID=UPI00049AFE42|nr:hypothetical protein PPF1_73 [Rhizobium phage vB_RleM_PPF1]AID18386.1 hypothetical protein PPF1_73 [Rhizobium phage vB_RleM_PPF1]